MELENIQKDTVLDIEVQFALENDVWFNATKMVKNFNESNGMNKRLDKFWELDETKEYITELELESTVPPSEVNREVVGFKRVINSFDEYNGTYVHPELGILLARYLSTKFARACDKFIKQKMSKAEELTPIQLMEKAYQLEAQKHEHTQKLLDVEKSITKTLEVELDAVTDTDGLLDMKSFSMLVTSRTHGVNFGRTKVYMALRACGLVGDDTRATQRGLTTYLETRMVQGANDKMYPKTFVIGHKFEKLLSLIIRKIQEDEVLNEQLGNPFGRGE